MNGFATTVCLVRGQTAYWTTTFYDQNGNVTQPGSATINVVYPDAQGAGTGGTDTTSISMVAPTPPAVTWTAQLDTRGFGPGSVAWSIHSDPGPPYAVEDGSFTLTANPANLLTFT